MIFLLKYKYCNLGGMALLKTACHMPLISLRDMPSATIFNNNSEKKMSKKEEREDGGRGQMTVIKCKNDVKSRSGLVVVARITPSHEVKARHYQLNPSVFCR